MMNFRSTILVVLSQALLANLFIVQLAAFGFTDTQWRTGCTGLQQAWIAFSCSNTLAFCLVLACVLALVLNVWIVKQQDADGAVYV